MLSGAGEGVDLNLDLGLVRFLEVIQYPRTLMRVHSPNLTAYR
jgi:hypothetical protein